jgi:hypothetical protein
MRLQICGLFFPFPAQGFHIVNPTAGNIVTAGHFIIENCQFRPGGAILSTVTSNLMVFDIIAVLKEA